VPTKIKYQGLVAKYIKEDAVDPTLLLYFFKFSTEDDKLEFIAKSRVTFSFQFFDQIIIELERFKVPDAPEIGSW